MCNPEIICQGKVDDFSLSTVTFQKLQKSSSNGNGIEKLVAATRRGRRPLHHLHPHHPHISWDLQPAAEKFKR